MRVTGLENDPRPFHAPGPDVDSSGGPCHLVVWEWAGAVLFACLGTWYLVSTWGRMNWSACLLISGPLFLVGAIFLIDWMYRTRLATK